MLRLIIDVLVTSGLLYALVTALPGVRLKSFGTAIIVVLVYGLSIALRYGVSVGVANRATMANPCINSYCDRDGSWFWIVGLEGDRHWPPLARAAGHPEWIEDERFATLEGRAKNAATLVALLDEVFATRSRDEWAEVFETEEDLWWAPVQSLDEVVADEQVRAAGGFAEVPDGGATTLLPATPVDFGGTPGSCRCMAPGHGEHTDEILRELGRDADAVAALHARGIVH